MRGRLLGTLVVPLTVALTTAVMVPSAPAAAAEGDAEVLNVLPPGSRGTVSIPTLTRLGVSVLPDIIGNPTDPTAAIVASEDSPQNFADQWPMYDGLNRVAPGSITDPMLDRYFKNADIGLAAGDAVSTSRPRDGVTIRRDRFGVPHIEGNTPENVAYGAGYAGIEDRMFLTDVLRHTGAAQLAAFLGPSEANIVMDQEQLLVAPYTRAEAQAQIGRAVERYPEEAPGLLARVDAYLDGMNAAQRDLCPLAFGLPLPGDNGVGLGPRCPNEYVVLQKSPTPYTRADLVYIASLVGGIFGKGGGTEFANGLWYQALRDEFGPARAKRIFEDLREREDPEAFTTATTRFPYLSGGLAPGRAGVALPVPGAPVGIGTAADAGSELPLPTLPVPGTAAHAKRHSSVGIADSAVGPIDMRFRNQRASNALLVGAKESADGHPVAVFGPQTGYYTPQLLTEVDLKGPGIEARGVSFAGTQFIVELGRGRDYAWSATSAGGDLVDTVMERLCNPNGSTPTVNSTHYRQGGACVPLDHYIHNERVVVPTAGGTGLPRRLRMHVYRTAPGPDQGIVQLRTLAEDSDGDVHPVAVVTRRSTYQHEVDSVAGFARINDPDYVHNARDFQRAFHGVDYTFNWFYADDRDIGYFMSGLLPKRPGAVEPDLPRWGNAEFDWRGFLPMRAHPQQINPPRGWTASWNNKQAPGWGMADDEWGHGPLHRADLLADRIAALTRGSRTVTRAELVGAMIDAATVDSRADGLLRLALRVIGDDASLRPALQLLRDWSEDGAHRVDRRRTGSYEHEAAIALFDTWWDNNGTGNGGLSKDVVRPVLGDLVDEVPEDTDDHPRLHVGSTWLDVGWYGWASKAMRQALGAPVKGAFSEKFCGSLATCRSALRASLAQAVQRALSAQGVSSVGQLTFDKHIDDIVSVTAGVVGVEPIDWQNRPTFQQVVHFTTNRTNRDDDETDRRALPATGMRAMVPVTGVGLVGVLVFAALVRRSNRPRSS